MRICLLTTQDLDEDPFPDDDWPCDPRPFLPEAEWHVAVLEGKHDCIPHVEELITQDFDLFFNLCDGSSEEDSPGIEVIKTLERHKVPYAGACSDCYEPTRAQMKKACRKLGIATPKHVFARNEADIEKASKKLKFPLFVKHHNSYASLDISRRSKVMTPEGLNIQARKIISLHGTALIEEFIEGSECTVLVAENPKNPKKPITYPPAQYIFPKGDSFKHSDLKWVDYSGLSAIEVKDPVLSKRLQDETARFFVELKGASFGRCDIRVAEDGTTYMLEINSNCGIYYPKADWSSADVCLSFDPEGHEGFTRLLVEAALARHRRLHRSSSRKGSRKTARKTMKKSARQKS